MPIKELRVAVTTDEFDRVVAFYRDGLGLDPADLWTSEDGGRGQMFFAGRATLEVFNSSYADHIDSLEVGERVSGQIRFAFEVPDVHAAIRQAVEFGANLVHEPKLTPWGDLNARVQSPEGLQVTLYQFNSSEN
jgi:lactoylglutathione lyase